MGRAIAQCLGVQGLGRNSLTISSPADLPNLKQWLKADAGLYQDTGAVTPASADGDPVGLWQDQSGQSNHRTQATASKRALLKTGANGQNSLPVVLFDGVDDELSDSLDWSAADYVTIYLAVKAVSLGAAPSAYAITCAAQKVDLTFTNTARIGQNTVNSDLIYAALDASAAFRVYANLHRNNVATAYALWSDGVSQGLTTSGGPVNRVFATGSFLGSLGGSNWLNAKVGEVIVYFAQHGQTEVNAVTAYLRSRWGTG